MAAGAVRGHTALEPSYSPNCCRNGEWSYKGVALTVPLNPASKGPAVERVPPYDSTAIAVIVTGAVTAWDYLSQRLTGGRAERHHGGHEMTDTQVRYQAVANNGQNYSGVTTTAATLTITTSAAAS